MPCLLRIPIYPSSFRDNSLALVAFDQKLPWLDYRQVLLDRACPLFAFPIVIFFEFESRAPRKKRGRTIETFKDRRNTSKVVSGKNLYLNLGQRDQVYDLTFD